MSQKAQVVLAPTRPKLGYNMSIFLAGNTTSTGGRDWRERLCESLADCPMIIFNPRRDDWDFTWREDYSDARWAEQVDWELEMQDKADVVVLLFHGVSLAPVSLLELGLCAPSGKAIVCVLEGYPKAGNVEAVCRRHKLLVVRSEDHLESAIKSKLNAGDRTATQHSLLS